MIHPAVLLFILFGAGAPAPVGAGETPPAAPAAKLRHSTGTVVTSLAFSPDALALASAGVEGTIRLWDVRTGRQTAELRGHKDHIAAVCFSPDGRLLASAGSDRTARLWDPVGGKELHVLGGHEREVVGVAFSPDSKSLVSACRDRLLRIWDAAGGRKLREFGGQYNEANSVAWNPDGKTIAAGWDQGRIFLWAPAGDKPLREIHRYNDRGTRSTTFSPDGRLLACASDSGAIQLWDMAAGKDLQPLAGHKTTILSLAFSAGGEALATAGWDGEIRVWELRTGRVLLTLTHDKEEATAVAFSPDGRFLAGGFSNGDVLLWDIAAAAEGADAGGSDRSGLDDFWADLADADTLRAWSAVARLSAGGDKAAAMLANRLGGAVNAAGRTAADKRIARLVENLSSRFEEVREAAEKELRERAAEFAVELRRAMDNARSEEVRKLIAGMLAPPDGPAGAGGEAARPAPAAELLRLLRAIEVLERIGSPAARAALEKPAAESTDAGRRAKAALDRLKAQPRKAG